MLQAAALLSDMVFSQFCTDLHMHRFIGLTAIAASLCIAQPSQAAIPQVMVSPLDSAALADEGDMDGTAASLGVEVTQVGGAQWLLILGFLLTSGAISWGVYQYAQQQQWQHIEFLRRAIKEFEQDPEIYNALKILDFEEYRDYQLLAAASGESMGDQSFSFHVTDDLLCSALAKHDQRVRAKRQLDYQQDHNDLDPADLRRYRIETALRDWFNKMLNGLEHFGYFIESGFFTAKELEPWLNYWIKLIGDPAYRRPGASKVYDALYSYIHHSGFFGVQKLFERFGYRILPSPYRDNDLIALDIAPKFDTRVALTLAKASYLAYQDKQFVAEVVERWGKTLIEHSSLRPQQDSLAESEPLLDELMQQRDRKKHHSQRKNSFIRHNFRYFNNKGRDTQAYMFRTESFMVLAFRGSQEPKDWLTNVTTQLRNFTIRKDGITTLSSYKGRVHTGFFLAWASIERAVLSQIGRWREDAFDRGEDLPPLYITGHSLGGALATMAAAALSDNGINVAGVYTFGQPRVGDRTFVNQLNTHTKGKVFRFVNNNDIVPHVPPPFSIWNPTRLYGHIGTIKYFDAAGTIMSKSKLVSRIIDSSWGLIKGVSGAGFDMITDHNMEYYVSHLDKALKEDAEDKAAHMIEVG